MTPRPQPDDPFVCSCCGADTSKLRALANYVEALAEVEDASTEVEDDLRQWANAIEARWGR